MHFDQDRQPDYFGSRQEWFGMLLLTLFLLNSIRAIVLRVAGNQPTMQPSQLVALYLLTAGFIAATLLLLILQGLRQSPVYTDWLPVLFFLSGCSFLYYAIPPVLPMQVKDPVILNLRLSKRLATLQHIQKLSRLVVFRANLVAVLLMVFTNHSDRWAIGILANVLAFVFLVILTAVINRNSI